MILARHVIRETSARGVTFKRRADGAVEVWRDALPEERLATYAGPQHRRLGIIPANEWASVVSSMCTMGENGMTFNLALTFHTGGCAYDADAHEHDADESSRRIGAVSVGSGYEPTHGVPIVPQRGAQEPV